YGTDLRNLQVRIGLFREFSDAGDAQLQIGWPLGRVAESIRSDAGSLLKNDSVSDLNVVCHHTFGMEEAVFSNGYLSADRTTSRYPCPFAYASAWPYYDQRSDCHCFRELSRRIDNSTWMNAGLGEKALRLQRAQHPLQSK